jgi:isopentenyl-diphosphate delta-isomerase
LDETDLPAGPSIPASLRILEITDSRDRPLMFLQADAALRQKLYRRVACVALYGKGKILYLHKRAGQAPDGRWDFCSGPVLAGEAREDAARRLILEHTGLADQAPAEIMRRPADRELPAHLTLFAARLPRGVIPDSRETMIVDADELEGLLAHSPEIFSPALIWAAETGRLFS